MRRVSHQWWWMLSLVVACLLTHGTPALAISSYGGDALMAVIACPFPAGCGGLGALPEGTSVSYFEGSALVPPPIQNGNAVAAAAGRADIAPDGGHSNPLEADVTAQISGSASGPAASFAGSFASAVLPGVLSNQTNITENFPLFFDYHLSTSEQVVGQAPGASAHVHGSIQALIDGTAVVGFDQSFTSIPGTFFDSQGLGIAGSVVQVVPLAPGLHFLLLEAELDGFASTGIFDAAPVSTTPEPTTLLLFGTTAAGLGIVVWRRRRHA